MLLEYLPIIGNDLAAFGVYSAINCRNTVSAKSIVIVRVIFSPESGGSQKTKSARILKSKKINYLKKNNLYNFT